VYLIALNRLQRLAIRQIGGGWVFFAVHANGFTVHGAQATSGCFERIKTSGSYGLYIVFRTFLTNE